MSLRLLLLLSVILLSIVRTTTAQSAVDRLLFVREQPDGRREIYVIHADGSGETNLSNHAADDAWPVWSPDGTQIAFQSDHDGVWAIYVIDADGSNLRRITNAAVEVRYPAWNGTTLTFLYGPRALWQIDPADPDSEAYRQIDDLYDDRVLWSPDGRHYAGRERIGQQWRLRLVVDGTQHILPEGGDDGAFVWSPDSTRIAYERNGEIYIVTVESNAIGIPRNLTVSPRTDVQPAWAPDGAALVYVSNDDIWTISADGVQPLNLTPNTAYDASPAWSPDGTRIAFTSFREGDDWELYVMNTNGCDVRRLTHARGWDGLPQWQPQPDAIIIPTTQRAPAAIVSTPRANLRADGGENAVVLGTAVQGECLTITGRDSEGDWLRVRTVSGLEAWVSISVVSVIGDLAVVEVP